MLWSSSPTAKSLLPARRRKHLQPRVLQLVGVLEFVHQHMAEALAVVLAQRVVVAQQFVGAQHQFAEIDHAFAFALLLVIQVDLDQFARLLVTHVHVFRAFAFFLAPGDEPGDLLGHEAFFVQLHGLDDALDGAQLVAAVQDLEALGQAGQLPVGAQEAVAQAVESAYPHAAHGHRQHAAQPGQHFLGRLVGEGDRQHTAGAGLAGLQQPGDARGQYPRLARAGTGQDQGRHRRQGHGGQLFRVQVAQQRRRAASGGMDGFGVGSRHAGIVRQGPWPAACPAHRPAPGAPGPPALPACVPSSTWRARPPLPPARAGHR